MPSMIETLIGSGVQRPDEKRIVPTRRPLPGRPRDLLELFVALGREATIPSLLQACDLRLSDPRHMTFITLSRWPSFEELEAQPTPYAVHPHLRSLITGEEFRLSLVRRICDAYAERPRMLYVRIPRCAGRHFLKTIEPMHALIPEGLDRWKRNDQNEFIPALGAYLGRFTMTRTIMIAHPSMLPFIQATDPVLPATSEQTLPWCLNPPPRRVGDRLFTILREPTGLILSQVNAILTALQAPRTSDTPDIAALRGNLGKVPGPKNTDAWKAIGRQVLAGLALRNPICQALGSGTALSALQACRLSDIEIADFSLYHDWIKYTWDVEPEPATNSAPAFLTQADLDDDDTRALRGLIDEDLVFYAEVKARLAELGELKTSVRGRDLNMPA